MFVAQVYFVTSGLPGIPAGPAGGVCVANSTSGMVNGMAGVVAGG